MNDLDEVHEDVFNALRESFFDVPVGMCPSPDGIIARARARARRRRRRAGAAAVGLATAALVAIVVPSVVPASRPAPTAAASPVHLAAFDVVNNADGTTTYTLSSGLLSDDPAALQADLARHGIPALVTQGQVCSSNPPPADIAQTFVPARTGDAKSVAIDPSAIPAGTELSIGLSSAGGSTAVRLALINKNDYSCRDMPLPGADTADQPANKATDGADSNNTIRTPQGDTPGQKP